MASQFQTFTAGSVLTATQVNDYLMKQVVIVCDSSADYPASPVEGMMVADKALDALLVYTGSAWKRAGGYSVTAAQTWTPTVTQSGTVTHTVNEARYLQNGPLVTVWGELAVTGSGTSTNTITVTLPATASGHSSYANIGSGLVYDASATTVYTASVQLASTTTVMFIADTSTGAAVGVNPAFGLASGDAIRFQATYLVA